jgi:hypothetical protein
MTSHSDTEPSASPISDEQQKEFAEAGKKLAKILRAGKIASVSGWTLVVFGVLSALMGLFSLTGMVVAGGLLALGWNELRGRALLLGLDPEGARVLGRNQLAIIGLVVAYCLWQLYSSLVHPNPQLVELEELVGFERELVAQLTILVYTAVMVITAVAQGLLSRWHFAREKQLQSYLEETPDWIVTLQKFASTK